MIIVDSYLDTEHSDRYGAILRQLRKTFTAMAVREDDAPLLMTELDVMALDEAAESFILICKESDGPEEKKQIALKSLNGLRQELAEMKLRPVF